MHPERRPDSTHRRPLCYCSWLAVLALGFSVGAQEEDQRATLLGDPQYVEPAVTTTFVEMTPEALRGALKVVSARTYAYYGFNNPEVQLHLPAVDNSTFARIEMSPPRLVDAAGSDVAYELERGLHDAETQIAEFRLLAEDGESPADFARVIGEISLLYPLAVESRAIASGQSDPVVRIDGPFVEVVDGTLPATAPFSPLEAPRAYDAQGRQLKRMPYATTRSEGEKTWRAFAYHGAVARVEFDRILQTVEVQIRYDMPIRAPLPKPQRGAANVDERTLAPHPDSRITIDVGAPGTAAATAPLPGPGETVPILDRGALSKQAGIFAEALEALEQVIPSPLAIVQIMASPPSMVSISLDTGDGVKEWISNNGEISAPSDVDTQWLQCKQGMPADALALQRVPAIWDDAVRRAEANDRLMQLVVGQYPCGAPYINAPFAGGLRVEYQGNGRFMKVVSP